MASKPISLLRTELHAFCELVQRRGWRIAPGETRNDEKKCCCPMGAVDVLTGQTNSFATLCQWPMVFAAAFDGSPLAEGPYADLGREFRAHYCGKEGT